MLLPFQSAVPEPSPHPAVRRRLAAVQAEHAPTDATLMGWLADPDDAIVLAALETHGPAYAMRPSLCAMLYSRATRDAVTDGVHFTPLLAAMERADCWPVTPGVPEPDQIAQTLRPWVTAPARTPEELLALLRLDSPACDAVVARHATAPALATVTAILARPRNAVALAENPSLTPLAAGALKAWCEQALDRHAAGSDDASAAIDALRALLRQPAHAATAAYILSAQVLSGAIVAHAATDGRSPALRAQRERVLATLLGTVTLDARVLAGLVDRVRTEPHWLLMIAQHPEATPRVWHRILSLGPAADVVVAVARRPRAWAAPETAPFLLHSLEPRVLREGLTHAPATARDTVVAQWTAVTGQPPELEAAGPMQDERRRILALLEQAPAQDLGYTAPAQDPPRPVANPAVATTRTDADRRR